MCDMFGHDVTGSAALRAVQELSDNNTLARNATELVGRPPIRDPDGAHLTKKTIQWTDGLAVVGAARHNHAMANACTRAFRAGGQERWPAVAGRPESARAALPLPAAFRVE